MLGSCWHFSFHLRPCSPPASFSMSSVRKFNRFAWRVATSKLLWCVRLTPTRSALFNVTLNAVMSGAKRSRRLNTFGFACQGAICQHYPADNGAHDHPPPRSLMTLMLKAFADFPSGQLITDVAEYQWRLSRQLCPKMGLPQTVRNFNPARPAAAEELMLAILARGLAEDGPEDPGRPVVGAKHDHIRFVIRSRKLKTTSPELETQAPATGRIP